MNSYKVLFPIETTARELLYKLALSAEFAEHGYKCYLGHKSAINRLFDVLKPFVYFDKGYHPGVSEPLYDKIIKNEGRIVNLDEEGGVDFKESSTILSRYPGKLFDVCDIVFLWGVSQFNVLNSNISKLDDSKIIISGHPRFQLLKPAFQALYEKDVHKIKRNFGEYILINTNMGFGNNIRGDEFVFQNYGSRIHNLEKVVRFDKTKVQSFISIVKKLSSLGYNIILRPHPEEDRAVYKNAFSGLSNVNVIYEGSVIPWIIGAQALIHPDCTTGIEAFMLGKKSISFLPINEFRVHTFLPVELSHSFDDEEAAISFVLNKSYLCSSLNGENPLLDDYFSFSNNSCDLIIQGTIELMNRRPETRKKDIGFHHVLEGRVKSWLRLARMTLLEKSADSLFRNKVDGFDSRRVKESFEAVKSILNLKGERRIECVYDHLYEIS